MTDQDQDNDQDKAEEWPQESIGLPAKFLRTQMIVMSLIDRAHHARYFYRLFT